MFIPVFDSLPVRAKTVASVSLGEQLSCCAEKFFYLVETP